ncbi:STAS domain-containing protein [Mycobacterium sp. SMC-4]|uniref:STAS domain-containing protein n=1 Tax=Mycobacterium sp. SMC-4 TaxID=2857059 RepID=UPI0021B35E4A|nr:STAS domain-containing protein [Mycobacterium sp. SMC-4]UXA19470.1 STAS domain-containing protein [Mycobacterium sp. SMC-4]
MATPLHVTQDRRRDGTTVLTVVGELDLSNVAIFADAIATARAGSDGALLLVDLSGVEYLDSGAINVLFDHADQIELVVNPILVPVLTVSGLTDVVAVRPASD